MAKWLGYRWWKRKLGITQINKKLEGIAERAARIIAENAAEALHETLIKGLEGRVRIELMRLRDG